MTVHGMGRVLQTSGVRQEAGLPGLIMSLMVFLSLIASLTLESPTTPKSNPGDATAASANENAGTEPVTTDKDAARQAVRQIFRPTTTKSGKTSWSELVPRPGGCRSFQIVFLLISLPADCAHQGPGGMGTPVAGHDALASDGIGEFTVPKIPEDETDMDIHESLDRVLKEKEVFGDQFYSLFLDRYPEVRRYFEGVSMRRQGMMLTVALMAVERYLTGPFPAVDMYLNYLGTRHSDRGVPSDSYPKFRDALLATLERFHGNEWSPSLATQWGNAFDRAAKTILDGYRERFHV